MITYKHILFLISFVIVFASQSIAQEKTQIKRKQIKGWEIETGYFNNGQPYAKAGMGQKVLIDIESLSFDHKPLEGFLLKQFVKESQQFYKEYTVYKIGRKPNLPNGYTSDSMATDYATLISNEFKSKVDVMGVSTGGQIALCLAANSPEVVNKVIVISAAYKLSDRGVEIEEKAATYFAEKKYGKTMATLIESIHNKGIKKVIYKSLMRMMGRSILKNVTYPNDFQVEVKADIAMNVKDRLGEIKVPVLVISGDKDVGYSIEDVKKTAEGIPNAELIIYDGYGHGLFMSNYKEVGIKMKGFLE